MPESISMWLWVAVGDRNVCPDCVGRNGRYETEETWNEAGFPGDGATICNLNCRCLVFREDTFLRMVDHLNAASLMASQFDDIFDDVEEEVDDVSGLFEELEE